MLVVTHTYPITSLFTLLLYSLIAKCVISFALVMGLKNHMRSLTVGQFLHVHAVHACSCKIFLTSGCQKKHVVALCVYVCVFSHAFICIYCYNKILIWAIL